MGAPVRPDRLQADRKEGDRRQEGGEGSNSPLSPLLLLVPRRVDPVGLRATRQETDGTPGCAEDRPNPVRGMARDGKKCVSCAAGPFVCVPSLLGPSERVEAHAQRKAAG